MKIKFCMEKNKILKELENIEEANDTYSCKSSGVLCCISFLDSF